jgi:hypothetical protein
VLKYFLFSGFSGLIIFMMLMTGGCTSVVEDMEFENGIYTGEALFGKPNGQGTAVYELSDGGLLTYEGEWQNGKWRGHGKKVQELSDGSVLTYEGNWVNSLKTGQGVQIFTRNDGSSIVYDGAFINDLFNGRGLMTVYLLDDERIRIIEYDGEFTNGKKHGSGSEMEKDTEGNVISSRRGTWNEDEFIG